MIRRTRLAVRVLRPHATIHTPSDPTFLATTTPGLETIVADEVCQTIDGATVRHTDRGKIWFSVPTPTEACAALRTVDNLYLYLGDVRAGGRRDALGALGRTVADLPGVAALFADPLATPTFVVNASRRGDQTWSRFEAGQAVADVIANRYPQWHDRTGEVAGGGRPSVAIGLEVRVDVLDDRAWVAWRLTTSRFRFRGANRAFTPTALLPPVAHALVRVSNPLSTDRILDPFAGSGTIVDERASLPARQVLGIEIDPEIVHLARQNVGRGALIAVGDATHLPMADASVDAIITNLPFGRQILDDAAIPALYRATAQEMARVLRPSGRTVVLTTRTQEIVTAMSAVGFEAEVITTVGLNGQRPDVVRFRGR